MRWWETGLRIEAMMVSFLEYLTYLHSDFVVLTFFFTFPQIINVQCRRFKLNGI